MDSLSKREKLKAEKKVKITRRVPQVGWTLCWAHGTPIFTTADKYETHLDKFYPQPILLQEAKKISAEQDRYEAETPIT